MRFPPLLIRTGVFRTCIFHPCIFVLSFSVLAFSVASYLYYINFTSTKCVVDAAGVTTVTWTVELLRDSEDEPTEKFKILLRSPSNALLGQLNRAVVHVLNVDNGP